MSDSQESIVFCNHCGAPTWAASDAMNKSCPSCRIAERGTWYEPSATVQGLLDQIAAIVDYYEWATRDPMQLSVWLKDATRAERGLGPS